MPHREPPHHAEQFELAGRGGWYGPSKRWSLKKLERNPAAFLLAFERELIGAPSGEGRARSKVSGINSAVKPKLTPHQKRDPIPVRNELSEPAHQIAGSYKVSHSTISLKGAL
jgi:hypothetical protein